MYIKKEGKLHMTIGIRLKISRNKLGLSQEDVAKLIGTHRTTISKYEKDDCEPSIKVLKKLIKLYCVDADYILFGKKAKSINISNLPENVISKLYLLIAKNY